MKRMQANGAGTSVSVGSHQDIVTIESHDLVFIFNPPGEGRSGPEEVGGSSALQAGDDGCQGASRADEEEWTDAGTSPGARTEEKSRIKAVPRFWLETKGHEMG